MRKAALFGAQAMTVGAFACCGVGGPDQNIEFGRQQNVIIYNSRTQTEFFVRDARFSTAGEDLGFIAPTPTKPELSEVDPEIFAFAASLQPIPRNSESTTKAGSAMEIESVKVAGFVAHVMRGGAKGEIQAWLDQKGYKTDVSTGEWIDHYVKKGWYLTAFEVDVQDGRASTGVVGMKFQTPKPFNPYFVPESNVKDSPGLQLTVVSDQQHQPTIGETQLDWVEPDWKGKANSTDMQKFAGFLGVSAKELPTQAHVTSYTDHSFPRSGTEDIYFQPVPTESAPALMVGVAVGFVAILGAVWWTRRRPGT